MNDPTSKVFAAVRRTVQAEPTIRQYLPSNFESMVELNADFGTELDAVIAELETASQTAPANENPAFLKEFSELVKLAHKYS